MTRMDVIGAPSSAGAYTPGQERAPQALRAAGLLETLERRGIEVVDRGDVPGFRRRADLEHPRAMNSDRVAAVARSVTDRTAQSLDEGAAVLVLGGDCAVGIGTVAGASIGSPSVGLVYVDLDADLNTPLTTTDGALDWMGVAHLLALPDTVPALAGVGPRTPLLSPDQVLLFRADNVTPPERGWSRRMASPRSGWPKSRQIRRAPPGPRCRTRAPRFDRIVVHVDVDVRDYLDLPIAEEARRNRGLRFTQLTAALRELLVAPGWVGLTICELNPDHGESDGSTLRTFGDGLADVLSGALS
jgi:arginase